MFKFLKIVHQQRGYNSASEALVAVGFGIAGFFLLQLVGTLIVMLLPGFSMPDLLRISSGNPSGKEDWWKLIILQGVASFMMCTVTALLYWYFIAKKKLAEFNTSEISVSPIISIIVIQLLFLPLVAYVGSINEAISLPSSLSLLEELMKDMENQMAKMTEFIAKTDTYTELAASFFVIAVIAGVGEELLFRGVIQRKLIQYFKSYHVAIWVTAALFSAIHFQFYGFLPRMLLGAMFGYFYVWTGNIWIPIIAHVVNNGLAVILFHLVHKGVIPKEVEKMDTLPFASVLITTLLGVGLLNIFWQKNKEQ